MTEAARRPSEGALSEINITPLIDVMLVLLIIFMVVTPLATKSLDMALPPNSGPEPRPNPQPALVLEVGQDGLRLNRSPITGLDELGDRLRDVLLARSDKTLFFRAEGGVRYAAVMAALDVARGAGAERIGILGREPNSVGVTR
jgi:biopolymer transport protein ExbD